MTESEFALARRLRDCPHFQWMPGMAAYTGHPDRQEYPVSMVEDPDAVGYVHVVAHGVTFDWIPDLNDEVTRLAIAAVARLAWCDVTLHATPLSREGQRGGWQVWTCDRESDYLERGAEGTTEVEAWVACIEAAPRR